MERSLFFLHPKMIEVGRVDSDGMYDPFYFSPFDGTTVDPLEFALIIRWYENEEHISVYFVCVCVYVRGKFQRGFPFFWVNDTLSSNYVFLIWAVLELCPMESVEDSNGNLSLY